MGVFVENNKTGSAEAADPRLTPTPDYGTMGPDSDFAKSSGSLSATAATSGTNAPSDARRGAPKNLRLLQLLAVLGGMVSALLASGGAVGWKKIASTFSSKKSPAVSSGRFSVRDLAGQKAQKQAEILLTQAVSRSGGASNRANDEIQAHAESWRGKLNWNPELSQLTTVALNSSDQNVRTSGIEVQLAAYGLSKSDPTVEGLVVRANSSDHAQKIWALWALGLLGNRGVETDRVVQVLRGHLKDSGKDSEDSRRWAVEGLALVGTTETIAPLLDSMHNDPSPLVRERAACSLAESGMLSHEQRLTAVPQLINYTDDPALDAQTHGWAFQALHDITKQPLPNDSAAWRNWYQNSVVNGQ
jgi:hypothetical protein